MSAARHAAAIPLGRDVGGRGARLVRTLTGVVPALVLPVAILLVWQVAAARRWVSPQVLPSPSLVAETLADLVRTGEILSGVAISVTRIAWGLLIGGTFGALFGLLLGASRRAEAVLGTTFRAVAAVPSLGWLPILILVLGLDESLKIVILSKACFVPMAIGVAEGVRAVPPALKDVAHVLGLGRRTRFLKLTLPAVLPFLVTGFRLAAAQAFVSLIVVEMLAGTDGIGYMMVWGRTLFQLDIVMAGMVVIGVAGLALDRALRALEHYLAPPETRGG